MPYAPDNDSEFMSLKLLYHYNAIIVLTFTKFKISMSVFFFL